MSVPLIAFGLVLGALVSLAGITLVVLAMYAAGIESRRNRKWEL